MTGIKGQGRPRGAEGNKGSLAFLSRIDSAVEVAESTAESSSESYLQHGSPNKQENLCSSFPGKIANPDGTAFATSILNGVEPITDRRRYKSVLQVGDEKYVVGEFDTELAAGYAYDHAALCVLGKGAVTNFDWQIPGEMEFWPKEQKEQDLVKAEYIKSLVRKPKKKGLRSSQIQKKMKVPEEILKEEASEEIVAICPAEEIVKKHALKPSMDHDIIAALLSLGSSNIDDIAKGMSKHETSSPPLERTRKANGRQETHNLNWWFLKHVPLLQRNILEHTESIFRSTTRR